MPTPTALPLLLVEPAAVADHTHDWVAQAAFTGWDTTHLYCRICHCEGRRRSSRRGFRGQLRIEPVDAIASESMPRERPLDALDLTDSEPLLLTGS